MPENFFSVILYSYRRPEMTKKAIERITGWPRLGKLYVSIDGVRENSSEEERLWRREVVKVSEKAAELNSKVIPVVWEINQGLTNHAIRIMQKVVQEVEFLIAVEEDNLILSPGFDFLADGLYLSNGPFISTAYSSSHHNSPDTTSRSTFFPEQWTTALNQQIFEAFERVWKDKKIDSKVVLRNFSPIFKSNPLYLKIVSEKWLSIFRNSVSVPNHGDALMTYAALTLDTAYIVPMNSLVSDLGSSDDRGMNPRISPDIYNKHSPSILKFDNRSFCSICEFTTNRVKGMGITQAVKAVSRRMFLSRVNGKYQIQ
jgi:hypothetical protein